MCIDLKNQLFMGSEFPLTIGKIYQVIALGKSKQSDSIELVVIEDDKGNQQTYFLTDGVNNWFIDAKPFLREKKLNQLLNETNKK